MRSDLLKQVEKEIDIWQRAEHFNVVMIFECIDGDDSPNMYVVMMYCNYGQLLDFDENETFKFIRNEKIYTKVWDAIEMDYFGLECSDEEKVAKFLFKQAA